MYFNKGGHDMMMKKIIILVLVLLLFATAIQIFSINSPDEEKVVKIMITELKITLRISLKS